MARDLMGFDEWVRFVFDHPEARAHWFHEDRAVERDFDADDPNHAVILVEYLTNLFENGSSLLGQYSDAQIATGLWYLFGVGSGHMRVIGSGSAPERNLIRMIRALSTLCHQVFAKRCGDVLSHLSERGSRLDVAVYMIWDMDGIGLGSWGPELNSVDRAMLDTLREILMIDNTACQESALHGLGESYSEAPTEVAAIVDEWLEKTLPKREELIAYASAARVGDVL